VAEFFHLDWTNSARRHLGVPVLHLLEHDAQKAGSVREQRRVGDAAGETRDQQ
jgi:hypothetical protein